MKSLTLQPVEHIQGTITLPGSKSISNRALLLAAISQGITLITNLLYSDDIHHMLTSLSALGVACNFNKKASNCRVHGLGGGFHTDNTELFLGNAGTAMRPLCAALCLGSGTYTLTGDTRMQERPIGELVDALRQAGADITYLKNTGYPPLQITGTGLQGGTVEMDGSVSSQFLTAFLLAAPLAAAETTINIKGDLVSSPYIDITLNMMESFGVQVTNHNYRQFVVPGNTTYQSPGTYLVEGDASSASYFLAAAAIKGGSVRVQGVGKKSIQGDIHFAQVLEMMGAEVCWGDDFIEVSRKELHGIDLDLNHIPDAAMTLATTALFAQGPTSIRNVSNWRVKETDRLAAMATELQKVGARVEEGEDYITIIPPKKLKAATIDTYNDHRMAMCFALVALGQSVTINDPDCTAKTFPDFFRKFAEICK